MSAHPSLTLLAERAASIPAALELAGAAPLPFDAPSLATWRASARFVITGGGLSEGPARVLASLLSSAGRDARFVPQSAFCDRARDAGPDCALVLFSQGLAPNARLPLPWLGEGIVGSEGRAACARGLLVTSVVPGLASATTVDGIARRLLQHGHLVWTLPPEREDRLLLRIVGPAVAIVAAIRLAAAIAPECYPAVDGARYAELARDGLAVPGADLFGDDRRAIAIVATPALMELAMPLRWKLLEGLRISEPPVWDPLQVAHGPLQSFYDERITLVALRTSDDDEELFARLRAVLRDGGSASPSAPHRYLELAATAPHPHALVELDAQLDAHLLATLARHPLALDDWPSRGKDGPIYDFSPGSAPFVKEPRKPNGASS